MAGSESKQQVECVTSHHSFCTCTAEVISHVFSSFDQQQTAAVAVTDLNKDIVCWTGRIAAESSGS